MGNAFHPHRRPDPLPQTMRHVTMTTRKSRVRFHAHESPPQPYPQPHKSNPYHSYTKHKKKSDGAHKQILDT
jgi:hypothetical protein